MLYPLPPLAKRLALSHGAGGQASELRGFGGVNERPRLFRAVQGLTPMAGTQVLGRGAEVAKRGLADTDQRRQIAAATLASSAVTDVVGLLTGRTGQVHSPSGDQLELRDTIGTVCGGNCSGQPRMNANAREWDWQNLLKPEVLLLIRVYSRSFAVLHPSSYLRFLSTLNPGKLSTAVFIFSLPSKRAGRPGLRSCRPASSSPVP